jgi:CheY-like chemotaxis protein
MVFGFVKQSDGHVTIYSEVGRGTTVKLYLPRAEDVAGMAADPVPLHPPTGRNECVLVVEDDADVRTLAVALLSDLGYRVLDAGDGAAALGILERERHIDLLFTDVILPGGMNGDAIALAAPRYQPNIKVMFMSGFTQDALIHQGKLGDDVVLLHKPFRFADLANKLRQALDGPLAADASIVE